jgi:hypothetical protein
MGGSPGEPAGLLDEYRLAAGRDQDQSQFKINLSRTKFPAGTYTFIAKNTGQVPHAGELATV